MPAARRAAIAAAIVLAAALAAPGMARGPGSIAPTGEMNAARFDHVAALLPNGRVLVVGGLERNGVGTPSAEVFDPLTGRFTGAAKPRVARSWGATAARLADGRVLLTGGSSATCLSCRLADAEIYDPVTGAFTRTGSMTKARAGVHSALLGNGDVLVVGGEGGPEDTAPASAELYHPASGTFTAGPQLDVTGPTAVVPLKSGSVAILGYSGAEVYEPQGQRLRGLARFAVPRSKFGTALLADGRVLVAGGQTGGAFGPRVSTTQIYDPAAGSFAVGPDLHFKRFKLMEGVVALPDGRVLIGGGAEQAEVYDPAAGTIVTVPGATLDASLYSTATLLNDGRVLLAGGYAQGGQPGVRHAWLYKP